MVCCGFWCRCQTNHTTQRHVSNIPPTNDTAWTATINKSKYHIMVVSAFLVAVFDKWTKLQSSHTHSCTRMRDTHKMYFTIQVGYKFNLYGSSSCPMAKTDCEMVILKSEFWKGWKTSQIAASLPHLNSNNRLFFVMVTACFMRATASIFNAAQMNSMLQDVAICSSVTRTNCYRVRSKRTPYFSSWLPNLFWDIL